MSNELETIREAIRLGEEFATQQQRKHRMSLIMTLPQASALFDDAPPEIQERISKAELAILGRPQERLLNLHFTPVIVMVPLAAEICIHAAFWRAWLVDSRINTHELNNPERLQALDFYIKKVEYHTMRAMMKTGVPREHEVERYAATLAVCMAIAGHPSGFYGPLENKPALEELPAKDLVAIAAWSSRWTQQDRQW